MTAKGDFGIDLAAYAQSITPVTTPLVNILPRRKGVGVDVHHWKGVTSFDSKPSGGVSAITYTLAMMQTPMVTQHVYGTIPDGDGAPVPSDFTALLQSVKAQEEAVLFGQILSQAKAHAAGDHEVGATIHAVDGHITWQDVHQALVKGYITGPADPDILLMAPKTHKVLQHAVQADGESTTTFIHASTMLTQDEALCSITKLTHIVNECTGKEIPIVLSRFYPEGVIIGLTLSWPYPIPSFGETIDVIDNHGYMGIRFGEPGPEGNAAVYVNGSACVKFVGGIVALTGINVGG